MAHGSGMKLTRFACTPKIVRFLIRAFDAAKMDGRMMIILNGDGNQRAVISQGMVSVCGALSSRMHALGKELVLQ